MCHLVDICINGKFTAKYSFVNLFLATFTALLLNQLRIIRETSLIRLIKMTSSCMC